MSANHSSLEHGYEYDVNPLDHEDASAENTSPLASHDNVDAQETSISSNSLIFLNIHYMIPIFFVLFFMLSFVFFLICVFFCSTSCIARP